MQPYEWLLQNFYQREIPGVGENPWIKDLSQALGHTWVTSEDVPWCSEAVNVSLLKTGFLITGSAAARSFLKWGEETKTPTMGDIAVFWRNPKGSNNGHVGFYINETPTHIRVLGGNQNNEVNISEYPKTQLLSYRKVPKKVGTVTTILDKKMVIDYLAKAMGPLAELTKKLV